MVDYDPYDEQIIWDPHPIYARLRAEAPVLYLPKYDAWALACFEDVWNASMDPDSYVTTEGVSGDQLLTRAQPAGINIMQLPAADHVRARGSVSRLFMPRNLSRLEPEVRRIAREAVDALLERGELDVVDELGAPLAVKVACMVNGFPVEDGDWLSPLVQTFFRRDEGATGMSQAGLAAHAELHAYFLDLARTRRKQRTDARDVVNLLLDIELASGRLNDEELAWFYAQLLIAGSDTLPKVLANTILQLYLHPDQRAEVIADPPLILDAFMEVLRYDMPTQFLGRRIVKDVEIRGHKLRAGQSVIFLYPSANRDAAEFDRPDEYDVHRRPPRTLGFGHGLHACLGRHVARFEANIALQELLSRAPDYVVDTDRMQLLRTEFVRGYESMPVSPR